MANTINWGQAAVDNTIDYGQGATDNTISWGKSQTLSPSGETNITGAGGTPAFTNTLSTTFDGADDYLDLGVNSNLVFLGARSMSVWLKFTDNGSTRFVANFNSDQQGMYTSAGKVYFFNRDASFTSKTIATINTYNDNQWHNFIGINDGTNLKMYVDGVLVNSNTDGSVGNTNQNRQRIGARWNGNNVYSGLLDEFAYFNSDISSNASAIGSTIPTDLTSYNPLGWWRMGDGSTYPQINDLGSGSNDGTMRNMTAANFVTDVPT